MRSQSFLRNLAIRLVTGWVAFLGITYINEGSLTADSITGEIWQAVRNGDWGSAVGLFIGVSIVALVIGYVVVGLFSMFKPSRENLHSDPQEADDRQTNRKSG